MKKTNLLTVLILVGLVAGALVGEFGLFDENNPIDASHWTKQLGDLLLVRPLMLMIIPLIFVSVVVGVTSIGDPSKLGVVGGSTVLYYLSTMLIAVMIGTTLVRTFEPGVLDEESTARLRESSDVKEMQQQLGQPPAPTTPADTGEDRTVDSEDDADGDPAAAGMDGRTAGAESQEKSDTASTPRGRAEISGLAQNIRQAEAEGKTKLGGAWMNILRQIIPSNIVKEMAEGRTLGVIMFALILGLALAAGGEKTHVAVELFRALFEAIMSIVKIIIWMTPIGVFLLVAYTVGKIGFDNIAGPLGKYIAVVIFGLLLHGVFVLPTVLFLFTRRNPYKFMWQMRRALMTAFGTDSSSATLPVTIDCAENEGGCSKRSANFVLPLGATVNMDGTALYEAVAVIFLFQLYGIELEFSQILVVAVTATLAAVGAAGIPSAGLVTMVIVILAVNKSLGETVEPLPLAAIGVIIGVDRIVDMCRTTVNVWGDAVGAKIITRLAPDIEEEREAALA